MIFPWLEYGGSSQLGDAMMIHCKTKSWILLWVKWNTAANVLSDIWIFPFDLWFYLGDIYIEETNQLTMNQFLNRSFRHIVCPKAKHNLWETLRSWSLWKSTRKQTRSLNPAENEASMYGLKWRTKAHSQSKEAIKRVLDLELSFDLTKRQCLTQ